MTSLIKSLSLKNFKGFSEEVRVELLPITLLFGANSAGKSSVLQALQYVREILERHNVNADRTLQGGEAIDLGGFLNLVHGRDPRKEIEIEVGLELGESDIPELVPEAFEEWEVRDDRVWEMYNALQDVRKRVTHVAVRLRVGWNEQREQPVVRGYEVIANGQWCTRITASNDGRDAQMRLNQENPIFEVERPDADAMLAEMLDLVDPQDLGQSANGTPSSNGSRKTSVLPEVLAAVQEAGLQRPGQGLRAWLSGFRGALPRLDQLLFVPAPGVQGAQNIYLVREFTAFLSWLTVGPALLLRDQLRQMRYIGPLRRIPPRGFEVSLTKSDSAWSDGMAAWETLVTGSQDLVERVSDWMESPLKLGTGYAVTRKAFQEFDPNHPVPQPIGPIRKRAQLVDGAGLTLQPQDVGVGISQVLPVVVAAQDSSASVVCIEQPELHIHPAVQVGLGDLFIDGAVNQGLSFLIETHSEHLILRLLRRIREAAELTSKAIDQPLSPALIGVYCLSKRNGAVTIDEIPVTKDGDFAKPWPQGFFDERGAELF
nr:AAA family ATPase [uncultured Roseateles sp.]